MAESIIDSWFIVDAERNVVEFNRAFYSLLPKAVARSLKQKKCFEVLELEICKDRCIAEQCWRDYRWSTTLHRKGGVIATLSGSAHQDNDSRLRARIPLTAEKDGRNHILKP